MNATTSLSLTALLLGLGACLSSSPPVAVRWFVPSISTPEATESEPGQIRLEAVTEPPEFDERMIWRISEVELAFDDVNRWLASPAELLRHAAETHLFDSGRFVSSFGAGVPYLQLEVDRFNASLGEPSTVELRIRASIHNSGETGPDRRATFSASEELESREPEAYARGMGRALDRVLAQLADWAART